MIEQLKNDNVEGKMNLIFEIANHKFDIEKRKHCEINNEIIRSNVRYHKAVSDVQSRNQILVKEKEQAVTELHSKVVELASHKAQVELLQATNDKILQRIEQLLVDGITQLKHRSQLTEPQPM
jgi:hypothetical protein